MTPGKLDLTNLEAYRSSCLELARERLSEFETIDQIAAAENDLNAYPGLSDLEEPREIRILDVESSPGHSEDRARKAVLEGRVFWEHTAAGEATRLKLGTKYLITVPECLRVEDIALRVGEELDREVSSEEIRNKLDKPPEELKPISLGRRHMMQLSYDLARLAEEAGLDPKEVLSRQKLLVILNEKTAPDILASARQANFAGFSPQNYLFMVQPAFEGIALNQGRFFFDSASPRRLHNHGQLVMQETMDDQIFRLNDSGKRVYLKSEEFGRLLEESLCKISYNIEDLDYLTGAVDWPSLSQALDLGAEGYNMVMEIVANDPVNPIKGGMAAWDPALGRNVMIESFQLKGLPNSEIKYLNKNFNHYTNPIVSWRALKENGLPMPVVVKNRRLYFQPVQGDINFLVKTAFVRRKVVKPIRAWKSAVHTMEAVNAMAAQERQPGFLDYVEKMIMGG